PFFFFIVKLSDYTGSASTPRGVPRRLSRGSPPKPTINTDPDCCGHKRHYQTRKDNQIENTVFARSGNWFWLGNRRFFGNFLERPLDVPVDEPLNPSRNQSTKHYTGYNNKNGAPCESTVDPAVPDNSEKTAEALFDRVLFDGTCESADPAQHERGENNCKAKGEPWAQGPNESPKPQLKCRKVGVHFLSPGSGA
ncbi:MAG: hypothetical protein JSW50_03210, partial [Candidatus Latescibacterota bacterium]